MSQAILVLLISIFSYGTKMGVTKVDPKVMLEQADFVFIGQYTSFECKPLSQKNQKQHQLVYKVKISKTLKNPYDIQWKNVHFSQPSLRIWSTENCEKSLRPSKEEIYFFRAGYLAGKLDMQKLGEVRKLMRLKPKQGPRSKRQPIRPL